MPSPHTECGAGPDSGLGPGPDSGLGAGPDSGLGAGPDSGLGAGPDRYLPKGNTTMHTISPDTHVADIVLADPSSARILEQLGIDYCCGGRKSLAVACRTRGLDPSEVIAALGEQRESDTDVTEWTAAPLRELVDHIVHVHHDYLRDELPALGALVAKVAGRHGAAHPELHDVAAVYTELAAELTAHLAKEERVLFPMCVALEAGDGTSAAVIDQPIDVMRHEHDEVAHALGAIRALSGGYAPPEGACNSYRAMLARLATLEADTHRHVHEENNILFPRALELAAAR